MTERQRNAAFKEGYWTGRLDGLLNRPLGDAVAGLRRPGTPAYDYSHGYVIGYRDSQMEAVEGEGRQEEAPAKEAEARPRRKRPRTAH